MVISYTEDKLNTIFNNPNFLLSYEEYIKTKKSENKKLTDFLDSLDINKKYHKISINKNKKYQSEETTQIKNINNLLNKCTVENIDNIKKDILFSIKNTIHILPLVLDSIIDKCIMQPNYVDLYINIIKDLLSLDKNYDMIFEKTSDNAPEYFIKIYRRKND